MSKPDDIPDDVWAAADFNAYDTAPTKTAVRGLISRAILAERDRCAVIAAEQAFDAHELAQATDYGRGEDQAARAILAAICHPQETTNG